MASEASLVDVHAGGTLYSSVLPGLALGVSRREETPMSSVVKKRRKKINRHKYKKRLKKTRIQRRQKK